MDGGVADDAALADVGRPGLELRLHERERAPARRGAAERGRKRLVEPDERDVADDERRRERKGGAVEAADVRPLEDGHARVVAQLRVQLAVADVEGADPGRAGLEEAVGEAAGRGSHVEAMLPGHVEVERVERVRELLAPARDEARARRDLERRRLLDLLAGLLVALHASGEDERLRLRAALREAALDKEDVQPLLHGGQLSRLPRRFPARACGCGRGFQLSCRFAPCSCSSGSPSGG